MYWISGKKCFQNFNFLLFWEWFTCYFWIHHPKINNITNFHKNPVNETQIINEDALPRFPRWPPRRQKRRIVVQTFNRNISETIWGRTLKFGTLSSQYVHMLQVPLKPEKVGFRHVPLWNFPINIHGCSNHLNLEMEAECLTKTLPCLNLNISRIKNGRNKL